MRNNKSINMLGEENRAIEQFISYLEEKNEKSGMSTKIDWGEIISKFCCNWIQQFGRILILSYFNIGGILYVLRILTELRGSPTLTLCIQNKSFSNLHANSNEFRRGIFLGRSA